jgi:hypothetical protein
MIRLPASGRRRSSTATSMGGKCTPNATQPHLTCQAQSRHPPTPATCELFRTLDPFLLQAPGIADVGCTGVQASWIYDRLRGRDVGLSWVLGQAVGCIIGVGLLAGGRKDRAQGVTQDPAAVSRRRPGQRAGPLHARFRPRSRINVSRTRLGRPSRLGSAAIGDAMRRPLALREQKQARRIWS